MAADSIFGATDAMALFREWLAEAEGSEPNDPNAIALATVSGEGMPNVRIVLLKAVEDDAFVFYTNYDSAKGTEIAATGQAAFAIHWKTLRRQIRVRGPVTREDGAAADRYYQSRGIESRLGAWASRQSSPLGSRADLMLDVAAARDRFGDAPPRPPFWGGFRLIPDEIEFWRDGPSRLHERELWRREWADRLSPSCVLYP